MHPKAVTNLKKSLHSPLHWAIGPDRLGRLVADLSYDTSSSSQV